MSSHIRIPFLIDIHRVTSSRLIIQEVNNPDLDRDYIYRGPLINRLIVARMKAAMRVKELVLRGGAEMSLNTPRIKKMFAPPLRVSHSWFPSAESVSDLARINEHAELEARINKSDHIWDEDLIQTAAKFVRGEIKRPADEIMQELTGRLFVTSFVSSEKTVRAGKCINQAIRSFSPFNWIYWITTGALHKAHSQLSREMKGDLSGVHSISIAVQNLTKSLEEMRSLYQAGHSTSSVEEIQAFKTARKDERVKLLQTIPGIGPVNASAIVATIGSGEQFSTGRDFAAWVGLTPINKSSGGKERLGRISKMGNQYLRKLLINGMTARVRAAKYYPERGDPWTASLLVRKPTKLASVAMANKTARVIWTVLSKHEPYKQPNAA